MPYGVAVDPGTHTVYVIQVDDDTMSVIDGSTREVTAKVLDVANPDGVAVDPGTRTVYVTNSRDVTGATPGTVSVIQPAE